MKPIDLRSDTVTQPSKAMREAIFNAEVGDDVFSEDPTVIKLQRKCAELSGKQSSLFVTTGCLGNQLAIKGHTVQGDEVICESEAHIFHYETSAPSIISNVQLHTVPGTNGVMNVEDIKSAIRSDEYYFPKTKLICLENTHNRAGGTIQPIENIKDIYSLAKQNNIKVHIDGARIFNASAETGITLKEYAQYCDSISFCFSKGLGAPVGSILCGDYELITLAHKWRKILGGGMRQSGILAAAALYALDNNVTRLKEDNNNAMYFAKEISALEKVNINIDAVQTNIVVFEVKGIVKDEFLGHMKDKGVLMSSGSYSNIRAVFHLDVSREEVVKAVKLIKEYLT
ncbi:MAG: low-specificity L-threonine aldolase [Ignavibacteriota bacterium]|nr:low-specificity L-threonine aldolase [Ignavibacteriota bacterium]